MLVDPRCNSHHEITHHCLCDCEKAAQVRRKLISWCTWHFLANGFIKINMDMVTKDNPGRAGFGGLIRYSSRNWIKGYYGFIGQTTSLMVELWGIRADLKLVDFMGFDKVVVESDCKVALDMI
ncbi:hypothetical protein F0562_031936 [Nyssa sinensis]|uniref:RNase H type-1 domain-containing protein n=1 Tax=Nyssa sinensis TaxID=561372 RepID=A0A5J5AVC6_9ASTE|nr:hypothetical protein F0562_031936 [Nyssa sinensis]